MVDFSTLLRIKQLGSQFYANHPKVPAFVNQIKAKGFCEGQEIAVAVRYPDGTEVKTGIRVRPEDLELLNFVSKL